MVIVEIDSNYILVKSLKNMKDQELTQAYHSMMLRFKKVGVVSKKKMQDN